VGFYKDDHTDVRHPRRPLQKSCRKLFSLDSVQQVILEDGNNPLKATLRRSLLRAHHNGHLCSPTKGNPEVPYPICYWPKWHENARWEFLFPPLRRAIKWRDPDHPQDWRLPARRVIPRFKKFTTRTMRPGGVNFDTCIKCELCWAAVVRNSCFGRDARGPCTTPNMAACLRLRCVCVKAGLPGSQLRHDGPAKSAFDDNASQWEMWRKDKEGYGKVGCRAKIEHRSERSHGFSDIAANIKSRVPEMLGIAEKA